LLRDSLAQAKVRGISSVKSRLLDFRSRAVSAGSNLKPALRRRLAAAERQFLIQRFSLLHRVRGRGRVTIAVLLLSIIIASFCALPAIQPAISRYFDETRLAVLRNLLATTGGALIGAAAIAFSIVMIAVQLNFARMPHGLFRRLTSDIWLLGTFAVIFLLAVAMSVSSLIPDASWTAIALLASLWETLLILVLFIYAYGRALDLINPSVQLRLVFMDARKDLKRWARRAQRAAPLLEPHLKGAGDEDSTTPLHDLERFAFFQANPNWTAVARRAIAHSIAFAQRYAEQSDHEVSGQAFTAITMINASYVSAKGKTFFSSNIIIDIPQASDAFINDTLEHLRRLAQIAISRGDEEAIRQTFTTLAQLVQVYSTIDYATRHQVEKQHARLAAGYLTHAVERVLPRNLVDVAMEGVRLMGASAQLLLVAGDVNGATPIFEKIGTFSCTGAVNENYRPVTLVGMEQLASLTFDLLRVREHDIGFAAKSLRSAVDLVVKMFLNVPDTTLNNAHGTYLAPYFSLAKAGTLGQRLAELTDALAKADKNDKVAGAIIGNIEEWSEELHQSEKTLLLLAIEKQSFFAFDSIRWMAHLSKLLSALARAPAASEYDADALIESSCRIISVISWIPDDKNSISQVEGYSLTDVLFETTLDACNREHTSLFEKSREILMDWAFKAGRHVTGWGTLNRALLALATVCLWRDDPPAVSWLRASLKSKLNENNVSQQRLDDAARRLREEAASLRRREFEMDRILHAAQQIELSRVRNLLTEIADTLSPGTATSRV